MSDSSAVNKQHFYVGLLRPGDYFTSSLHKRDFAKILAVRLIENSKLDGSHEFWACHALWKRRPTKEEFWVRMSFVFTPDTKICILSRKLE